MLAQNRNDLLFRKSDPPRQSALNESRTLTPRGGKPGKSRVNQAGVDHPTLELSRRTRQFLNSTEPVESLIFPIAARVSVRHLDGSNPFWILEAELRRHAQPQRKAERIGDGLARIFGCEQRLWM